MRKVAQDADGVRVTTDKGEFAGRFLIIAAPPGPIAGIEFEPHLPASRSGLHQRMPMGSIIKVFVAYETAFWRDQGFSGQVATDDDTVGLVMEDTQAVGPPILLCFIEGPHALELSPLGKAARRERVVASLVRFFGPASR